MTIPANGGRYLLQLARHAIERRLGDEPSHSCTADDLVAEWGRPSWLLVPGASFVTLKAAGRLRGCVGTLDAHRPLYQDVSGNAVAAAFRDSRFRPLAKDELEKVLIEVSVLSQPMPLPNRGEQTVLDTLRCGIDGLILDDGAQHRATFLPQVWENLPDPADFLIQLKRKAGLPDQWWSDDACLATYTVVAWSEDAPGAGGMPAHSAPTPVSRETGTGNM